MSMDVVDFIQHYGKKGMKWGQRRAQKKIEKSDKTFEKNASSMGTFIKVNNRAAQLTNDHDIDRINNKPQYKGKDFSDPNASLTKKYTKEHQDAFIKNLVKSADELGTNASGTKKYSIVVDPGNRWVWAVTTTTIEHADEVMLVKVEHDDLGHILSVEPVLPMKHDSIIMEEFIQHYGKKGMKWGVRKSRSQVKVSSDYKKTVPLRNRKTHELSNKQIQNVNARINLERNYRTLNPSKMKIGANTAKGILAGLTTAASVYTLANSPAGKAAIAAGKEDDSKEILKGGDL